MRVQILGYVLKKIGERKIYNIPIRGVGGVLEVVRPKVGAAKGRVGGGSEGPPPGKFCKKDTKSCVLGTPGTLLAQCTCNVQSSRVQYSVRLQMHNRSTSRSTSLEKGQSLMRICIDGS